MNYLHKILNKLKIKKASRLLTSTDAYKLWSTFYDNQPDNVVLYLERNLFSQMISKIDFVNKKVLDIGCGTGRHWQELKDRKASQLIGIDNSEEMLKKLKEKFPMSEVYISKNNQLENFKDSSFDLIISTLTIGHIKDIQNYFIEWSRVLKSNGELLITDFHPEAFSIGMKRCFVFDKDVIEVENYLYTIEFLKNIFSSLNWEIISLYEKIINEDVKHLFQKQNYMDTFNKFKGTPLILGLHLKKK
ncbi:MAG: class I SAM-dependent methyltransferase [bacterium]